MKQTYLKSLFLSLLMIVVGINVASAQTRTLWQEDFSSYSANDVPSGGTYNYVCKDGGSATKIYNENTGGGTAPELLVSRSGGTFYATVPLSNIEGDLTLTYKTNNSTLKVESTTEGVTGGVVEKFKGTHTVTFSGITTSMTSITIVFTATTNSNVRLDDILLTYTPPSNRTLSSISLSGTYPTTFKVGDTFSHEGMTVTATYDDETTEDVTSSATFSEPDMTTAGTKTVTVSYTEGDVTKTATYNITVNALTGDAYTLVTNVADLADGDNIIIVNKDAGKAMGGQNSNNRAATDVSFDADGNAIVPSSTDIQVFTLEGDANNGWYFYTGEGYIYAASSGSNYLRTETEKDANDNAKASITISDDEATVQFQGNNSRNIIRYNSGNNVFSCYSSGQQAIQLYKKPGSTATLTEIALGGDYPTTFKIGDEFSHEGMTVIATFDDGTTKDVTSGAVFSEPDMNTAGTKTVTVSYTKGEVTKTANYDITVNAVQLTGITLSGDYPTTFNVGDEFSHEGMTVTASYDDSTTEDVTSGAVFSEPDMSTAGTKTVTVSYTKADVTKTATYEITVNAVAVTGITLDKETVQLKVGKTTKLTATVEPDNATDKTVVWSSGDETVATVSEDGTVTAVAEGTATITAGTPDGAQTATCTVTVVAATAATEYYEKVTTALDDWSGEYLIVYEDGNNAFNGALETLDAVSNYIDVEIEDGKVEATEEVAASAFTIAKIENGYSIKSASGYYIGLQTEGNGLKSDKTKVYENSISFNNDGTVNVISKNCYLRFNTADNQTRYRYMKSNDSNNRLPLVCLYKKVEATSVTTYSLVKNDNTEIAFEGLTLTTDALPAEAYFHIKDNFGNNYYAISTDEEIPYAVAITAENHDDLSTRVSTSDDIEDICRFFLGKQNTWMFTITPAEDGTIKLSVSPQTEGETKYMIADETPYTETENVFTEDGKLTKVMTTASFFIVKSDDYAIVPLVPAESNTEDESRHPVWEFSGENNTVGFSMGNPYALDNYTYPYRMSEADTYNFTLDLENNTVTVEAVPTTYTLVADGGYGWSEWEFDGLLLNEEFPNGTEFYIKDNKGNVYYGEYGNSIIYAENHENLNTYYPVEDETVTEKPEPFELRKDAVWHFTITEPAEDGETIKLTVVPSTIEEIETKYMLSSEWMQTSEDVFDENLQITKDFTAGEAFYITREDGFGIFNVTAAEKNDPDGYYVWEFSEDAPTVGYLPAKTQNAFRMKDAGTYTITLDTENQTVTIETVPTTYTLVTVDETLTEYPFSGLTLRKELPAHTSFYIKNNKGKNFYSSDGKKELIISAENHENLPTYAEAEGAYFYLMKANTWVFTLTEASDGLTMTVNPETEGETTYMLTSVYLQESEDVFDENLQLTKEMTTEPFYITRSDDYGLTNLTAATNNAPDDYRYWQFSEEAPTVGFIVGEIRNTYAVAEAGTYTFTLDLENETVTAEKYVETVDVPVTSAEWATFVAPKPVIFPDDVTAYIVSRVEGNVAVGIQVTEAPAGTAVIVNGTEGTHKAVVVEEGVLPSENMLQASDGTVTGDGTIFVLAVEGGQPGFAPLANGKKLSAGKAYLQVDNASGAKINLIFDGESSDIRNIENAVDFSDGNWYNLQGVKVTSPQRGIYIHNGKKVVVK